MTKKLLDYFNGDELAANVWLSKYADEGETTPDDMHRRMAKEFARIDKHYQDTTELIKIEDLSEYGFNRKPFTEESIYELFKDFKHIIPQGSIMESLGTNKIASLSNCWVIESPLDSYADIHRADGDLIFYYKRRGGVGLDISKLRPAGVATNNTAKSSTGATSFMERFSNTTREVAMNGRRGALMITMDIRHPDSLEFIKAKQDTSKITGANISIRLNDGFMQAVENDEDYLLRFPCNVYDNNDKSLKLLPTIDYNTLVEIPESQSDGITYVKKIKAKEYWNEIIKAAHGSAEPGVMFWDNVIKYDPAAVYDRYKPISSNPCGEQFLNANDSCRLMALNLFSFVKNPFTMEAEFDFNDFHNVTYDALRLGDNLIDLEVENIDKIIEKIKNDSEPLEVKQQELRLWEVSKQNALSGRRIGLGITALGDTLAALGLKYDSEEALKTIEQIMFVKMEAELSCTIDLSILRGKFDGWDRNSEFSNYQETDTEPTTGNNNFYKFIIDRFPKQFSRMLNYGRRNISWSTVAPTGSVSILTATTSGVEPLFQPYYFRKKKINPGEIGVKVDFVDKNGDSWQEFPVLHSKFKNWLNVHFHLEEGEALHTEEELIERFKLSPWYGSTANDIDWIKRVEIQSILQRYTTNAISSTINLPKETTLEQVSEIYMEAWKQGLKGITVYRDGSRDGVLTTEASKNTLFDTHNAPKRPKELLGEAFISTTGQVEYNVFVGLLDNKPYEIFIDPFTRIKGKGVILKKSKSNYYFKNDTETINITMDINDEQAAITRLVSTSLRHGADIKFIVEQLQKTSGDLFGFTKSLARVLKKYIPDGAKSTIICNECGSSNVVFEEGCSVCKDCGNSKCG